MHIRGLQKMVHRLAVEKGWWGEPGGGKITKIVDEEFGMKMALIHSEVSEALEEYRAGNKLTLIYRETPDSKPEGIPIELADVVIRVLDLCEAAGINLEEAIVLKHEYNRTRSYRHGGKRS